MYNMSSFYELAKAVFAELELKAGANSIGGIDSKVHRILQASPASLGLSFYSFASQSFRTSSKELLVLIDHPSSLDKSLLDFICKVANEVERCKTATIVGEDIIVPANYEFERIDIECWNPQKLFAKILGLPSTFSSQLQTLACIQRPDEFPYAFQRRKARVRFLTGRQPVREYDDLSEFFLTWLSQRRWHSPILLLGERGSGKSWQMLRFALEAYEHHQREPWNYGPAFLVRLKDLIDAVENMSATSPVFCEYLFNHHPELSTIFGGSATLGALFEVGHAVVLVDGFDEMDIAPTDTQVLARLTSLLLLLSKKTKFVLSCRAGHFSSLEALFKMPAWTGTTIGQTFEVLEILPFETRQKASYIDLTTKENSNHIKNLLGISGNGPGVTPLKRALAVCASHPGILCQLKDDASLGVNNPLELISEAIYKIMLDFNLRYGRTIEDHHLSSDLLATRYGLPEEVWIKLCLDRRGELLGDLAWCMAERGTDIIDLGDLPPRIQIDYRIADDSLVRDIRSQTVFELGEPTIKSAYSGTVKEELIFSGGNGVPRETGSETRNTSSNMVRFTLRIPNGERDGVGESSVTGAYFLAQHIMIRLLQKGPFGELLPSIRLKCLGRFPLGPLSASLLLEMLKAGGISAQGLGQEARQLLIGLAKNGDYSIFCPNYRYLVSNLSLLDAFSTQEARLLDPWSEDVSEIVRSPRIEGMNDYPMVLVPPPVSPQEGLRGSPFLLGVREVTNEEYHRFVADRSYPGDSTVNGLDWSVERVTIAGKGNANNNLQLSPNHLLTNEYHLFHWQLTNDFGQCNQAHVQDEMTESAFSPPSSILTHPVTFLSWFAAAAFCDWVSLGDERKRRYKKILHAAVESVGSKEIELDRSQSDEQPSYRLPTKDEWAWAAKAGHENIKRPWEAYPYYLHEYSVGIVNNRLPEIISEGAWSRYMRQQEIMKAVLLGAGKESRPVLYDEPNDYGISGLIGNVREWSEDIAIDSGTKIEHLVLGATGFRGESCFDFNYQTTLYPRNTNQDVSFRIARSLSEDELNILQQRQEAIRGLPVNIACIRPFQKTK